MHEMIKNISKAEVVTLREQVACQPGQVVSRTLAQNDAVSITLFALTRARRSAAIAPAAMHSSPVSRASAASRSTVSSISCTRGESIVMPAGHPHAVFGQEQFKMLLVVVF